MPIPLQITVLNVPRSAALEARVVEMTAKLEKFHSRIVSCRVNIEELRRHRSRGRLYHVRVDLRVPGKEIVSNHRHDKDPYLALRDAFLSLRRQLEDVSRVKRGDVKKHAARTRRAAQGETS
jgi:ribosomal subunit interface protein